MTLTGIARLAHRSPFAAFRAAVERLSLGRIRVGRSCLLRLEGIPAVSPALLRGPGKVRPGRPEDLDRLALLGDNSREEFARRLAAGDRFAVALLDDRIIGYEWFSTNAYQTLELQYRFEIPQDTIYAFNAFILPEYRLVGVWLKFKTYLAGLMQDLNRTKVITYVDPGNHLSINSHLRFGFKLCKKLFIIQVRGAFSIAL